MKSLVNRLLGIAKYKLMGTLEIVITFLKSFQSQLVTHQDEDNDVS